MRDIGVVTVARSDFGCYLPVLREIEKHPNLRTRLLVSGTHLSPEFGLTIRDIEDEGFCADERIEMSLSSDSPQGIAKSTGLGVASFAQVFERVRPDILLVLGDRFEMLSAVVAAVPFNIPVAHIHGGELTYGVIDDVIRHSITKMSHLHFASTEKSAARIVQMGEEPWRVTVSGAPTLDNLGTMELLDREEVASRFALNLDSEFLLVNFHPVTLDYERTDVALAELLGALEELAQPAIITYPSADTQGHGIIDGSRILASRDARFHVTPSLSPQGYWSLMKLAQAMVGNSSSGIIEAPSLGLPVVNIGDRQLGRERAPNVIDVAADKSHIVEATKRATSSDFRASLQGLQNPYGDGHAAEKIVRRLAEEENPELLIHKRFYEVGSSSS